jgi:hypothetical protein
VAPPKAILDKDTIPALTQSFPYLQGYVAFYASITKGMTAIRYCGTVPERDYMIGVISFIRLSTLESGGERSGEVWMRRNWRF